MHSLTEHIECTRTMGGNHLYDMLDCLIIGGGPAGLTAATYLARFHRTVLVIDDGRSRAELVASSHNYPGFKGISGSDLLTALRAQVRQYGVAVEHQTATALRADDQGTSLITTLADGTTISARRVLLATGIIDETPALPGLQKLVYQGALRFCPICDGYEARDRRIGVLGPARLAPKKAIFLRTYSRDITLLLTDELQALNGPALRSLRNAGIAIGTGRVVDVNPSPDSIVAIRATGEHCQLEILYPALGCAVRSELAVTLGARANEEGNLIVDARQQTSVRNLYAAGDVVSDLHQIAVATGHAAIAATSIHNSLPPNFR
jgi:thioredoxin reductase (NADPH)